MEPSASAKPEPRSELRLITTQWSSVHDPAHFLTRYGPAIHKYLGALLHDPHDAEEVTQDFLLRAIKEGFPRASKDQGRFRFYLIAAVRNAAFKHLQQRRVDLTGSVDLSQLPASEQADAEWLAEWRNCVLNSAWRMLERHERSKSGNLFYTVLRLTADHPEESSEALAGQASHSAGREVSPEAFRKQLSRSRRHFAQLLVDEVVRTLDAPTRERVVEELHDTDLLKYVRPYLPADWLDSKPR